MTVQSGPSFLKSTESVGTIEVSNVMDKQWFPGLDGVRALAFLTVFFVHQKPPGPVQLNGGYAGVDLFFVLSGFLITTLLMQEFGRSGTISVRNFYLRRLVRLTPALLAFCAIVFALTFFDGQMKDAATSIRLHALGAMTYVYNWIGIHTTGTGHNPRYFGALWSLSVEEQFYAIWPLVILFVLRRSSTGVSDGHGSRIHRFNPKPLLRLLVLGIVVSNVLRVYFGVLGDTKDYNRAMWGTDVNASALLIGALGAVVRLHLPELMHRIRRVLPILTPLACAALAVLLLRLPAAPGRAPFAGGLFILHVLCMVMILGVVERSTPWINAVFELRAVRWIGKVSYGAYIVHYFFYLRFGTNGELRAPWILNLVLTLIVSGLSFRFFEQPIARYFRRRWKLDQEGQASPRGTTVLNESAAR